MGSIVYFEYSKKLNPTGNPQAAHLADTPGLIFAIRVLPPEWNHTKITGFKKLRGQVLHYAILSVRHIG
jgi:hypothetical protein